MKQYIPGTNVHHIQARKALEEAASWHIAGLDEIGCGVITLTENGTTSQFRCDDTARLHELFASGRVPITENGTPIVYKAKYNVLIVPCANEGATFPRQAGINANISHIEDGAAQYSPTDNGAWHLFSIDAITEQVGVSDEPVIPSQSIEDKIEFFIKHPGTTDGETPPENAYIETSVATAAYGSLRMLRELGLPWVSFKSIRGEHVVTPNSIWATGCGLIIPKFSITLRPGVQPRGIAKEIPALEENEWCWHFTNRDFQLDGMSDRYITWQVNPSLRRIFESYKCLRFYLPALMLDIPDWLDAEFFPANEPLGHAMIIYGLSATYQDIPRLSGNLDMLPDNG